MINQLLDAGKDGSYSGIKNYQLLSKELSKSLLSSYADRLKDIDFNAPDHVMLANMEMNLYRFSAAKNLATVNELNDLLLKAKSPGEFKQRAKKLLGKVNGAWLDTEADFAYSAGSNAARYQRQLAEKDAIPYVQYQTAGDSRVRDSHADLDGMVFEVGDPALSRVYPPNGYNCRCEIVSIAEVPTGRKVQEGDEAIARLKNNTDKNGISEWDRMVKSRMTVNRADTQEVFEESQFYVKNMLDEKFGIQYNGVTPYADIDQSKLPQLKKEDWSKGDALAWFASKVGTNDLNDKKNIRLLDKTNRPITIRQGDFKRHLKDDRISMVPSIESMLSDPDEIYLTRNNQNGKMFLRYVKFYKGNPMNTVVEVTESELRLKSWYKVEDKKIDSAVRVGVMVYKKSF